MSFWFKDGKIVVDATGKPIDCDECPCEGSVPITSCESCLGYTIPTNLFATFLYAGVTQTFPLTNVSAGAFNAIWHIDWGPSGYWEPCGAAGPRFEGEFTRKNRFECRCASDSCRLLFYLFFRNYLGVDQTNTYTASGGTGTCPTTPPLDVISTSPFHLQLVADLSGNNAGDCSGVGSTLTIDITE